MKRETKEGDQQMSTLTPKAQALVKAGRTAYRPTAHDRKRIEEALRDRLGADALTPDAGGANSTSLWPHAGWKGAAGVTVSVCVAAGVAFFALRDREGEEQDHPTPESTWVAPPQPQAPALGDNAVPFAPSIQEAHAQPSSTAAINDQAANLTAIDNSLAQEVALLSRATKALRAGHADQALNALQEHQRRFPSGALSEDRQAAKAQALCLLGDVRAGLAALSNLAPQSPAAARAQQVCDSASK